MAHIKLTTWWGDKSKTPYGILNTETDVNTPVNIAYRKMLNHVRIYNFFKKMLILKIIRNESFQNIFEIFCK